jgi:DHA1 family tetracycline resistance protein-like MFS transporter
VSHIRILLIGLFGAYMGFAMLSPLLAPLVRTLGLTEVQAGLLQSVSAFAWFLAGPFWGRRSDLVGRKPIFVSGLIGLGLGLGIFTLVAQAGLSGLLAGGALFALLFVGRIVAGALFSGSPAAAQAYIADVTTPDQRTRAMASLGAATGMGFVIGPAVSAALANLGLIVPLAAAALLPLIGGLIVAWRLPNPQTAAQREQPPRLSPFDARIRQFLLVGLIANVVLVMAQITGGFLVADRLALPPQQVAQTIGVALVISGLTVVAVQLGIVRRIKLPPVMLLRIGLLASLLSYVMLLNANSFLMFVLAFVLLAIGIGFNEPGFASAVTLAVNATEYGAVSGLTASVVGLSSMIGPLLGTGLYQVNQSFPYLLGIVTLGLMLGVVWFSPGLRQSVAVAKAG